MTSSRWRPRRTSPRLPTPLPLLRWRRGRACGLPGVRLRTAERSAVKFLAGGGRRRWRRGGGRHGATAARPWQGPCVLWRRARCGRAEGHSPPPRALGAPAAAPSSGLAPQAERGRMTELQSALLLRRQLAGTGGWSPAGGPRGDGRTAPRGGRGLRWRRGPG